MNTVPINRWQSNVLEKGEPLSKWLPYRFSNNKELTSISCFCEGCNQEFETEEIQAVCTIYSNSIHIQGMVYCHQCQYYSSIEYRVNNDLTFIYADHPDSSVFKKKKMTTQWWKKTFFKLLGKGFTVSASTK